MAPEALVVAWFAENGCTPNSSTQVAERATTGYREISRQLVEDQQSRDGIDFARWAQMIRRRGSVSTQRNGWPQCGQFGVGERSGDPVRG